MPSGAMRGVRPGRIWASRRACVLLSLFFSVALLWLNAPAVAHTTEPTACMLRDTLSAMAAASGSGSNRTPTPQTEVRLYWWFRWQGTRRFKSRREYLCRHKLRCIMDSSDAAFTSSHAVVVWVGARPERECLPPHLPNQPWLLEYSESPAYYPELWDAAFTARFSLKASYELDSDIVLTSLHPLVEGGVVDPSRWLPPHPSKRNAIVFLASNCESKNAREELVRRLQRALPATRLPLHSVGRCLHNFDAPSLAPKTGAWAGAGEGDDSSLASKLELLRSYQFCLVLENSNAADYVTEKLFHAFAAGCLPIYYGSSDVQKVLPHPKAVIQVMAHSAIEDLVQELESLAGSPEQLVARLAWREDRLAVRRWWRGLLNQTAVSRTGTKRKLFCAFCEAVSSLQQRATTRPGKGVWPRLPASRRPAMDTWSPLM